MAVTKRTRFEVLRRDEYTCQYCGAKAPDVTLHIDHVMPVSLGGDDKPGNLVTACKDCNGGKTSITPDSPLVEGLSDRAAAYALGMQDKMTRFRADIESFEDYEFMFHEAWDKWVRGDTKNPLCLPTDYRMSLYNWQRMGVPHDVFDLIIPVAQAKFNRRDGLKEESVFRYMAGVLSNMLEQREIDLSVTEESAAVYTQQDLDGYSQAEWSAGFWFGRKKEARLATALDPLRNHIDKTEPVFRVSGEHRHPTGEVVHVGKGSRENPD